MTIETKFNIGDEAWFMYSDRLWHGSITAINLDVHRDKETSTLYQVSKEYLGDERNYWLGESKLFRTKQELIESL